MIPETDQKSDAQRGTPALRGFRLTKIPLNSEHQRRTAAWGVAKMRVVADLPKSLGTSGTELHPT